MYYFVSDIHLGGYVPPGARGAEKLFVEWLESVADKATAIFINGDMFDFWFEYRRVVPKGFVRTLSCLSQLSRRGVRVVFMTGNHDQWVREYLSEECGLEVYTTPQIFDIAGRRVYVAHGDNLNIKRGVMLKFMNWCFHSSFIRAIFSTLIHPDLTMKFGQWWSQSSRKKHDKSGNKGRDIALSYLMEHVANLESTTPCDYYMFGHLHFCLDKKLESGARVIFTNDWSDEPHCAVMDSTGNIRLERV